MLMIEEWLTEEEILLQEVLRLSVEDAEIRLSEEIETLSYDIENSEGMSYAIADTNAEGFTVGDISVTDITAEKEGLLVTFEFYAEGEQMEEKMYVGTTIEGSGTVLLGKDGKVRLEDVTANVADYSE